MRKDVPRGWRRVTNRRQASSGHSNIRCREKKGNTYCSKRSEIRFEWSPSYVSNVWSTPNLVMASPIGSGPQADCLIDASVLAKCLPPRKQPVEQDGSHAADVQLAGGGRHERSADRHTVTGCTIIAGHEA